MERTDIRHLSILILIFLLLAVGISIPGVLYYRAEADSQKMQAIENLKAVAGLKVDEISNWRRERLADADAIASNPFIVDSFKEISSKGQRYDSKKRLHDYLDRLNKLYGYSSWVVYDSGYNQIMSSREINEDLLNYHPYIIGKIGESPFLSDLHKEGDGNISIDLVIPISSDGSGFIIMFFIDPSDFLYPLLQSWPTASKTGETALVERIGDEVLFLNDLRSKKGSALNLRVPARDNLPGTKAADKLEASMEGRDYRGVRVLAVTRHVKGTPWGLVAKIDREEVLSPLQMRLVFVVASSFFLLVVSGAALFFFWQRQLAESRLADAKRYREMAEELRETRDRFFEAQQVTHLGNWDWRIRENTLWWSDETFRILGLAPGEITPSLDFFMDRVHPADRQFVADSIDRSVKKNEPYDIEFRIVLPGGSVKTLHATGKVYYDDLGTPLRMLGILHDISERKQAEKALQESEEIFRKFMEYSPVYIFFKDENVRSLHLSKNFETMLGKPIAELLGKSMDELFPSELAKSMVEDDMRILKEGKEVIVEEELNGRIYSTIKFPIFMEGKPRYLAGFTMDITERRNADRIILESRNALRTLIDALPLWISFFDLEGRYLVANKRYSESFDRPIEEIEGADFRDVLPPSVLMAHEPLVNRCLHGETVNFSEVAVIGGNKIDVEGIYTPLFDQEGLVCGGCVFVMDVSRRKEMEAEYATLLLTTMDGFWEVDNEGRLVAVNDAYCRLSGYSREELLKMRISDIEAAQSPEEVAVNIKMIMEIGYGRFETRHYRKDGSTIDVEVSTNFRNIKGGRFYVFIRDISDRKSAEHAILKAKEEAERANSAKSQFLANMSHEIRTPMNAIIGLGYLARQTDLDPKQRDYVNKIHSAAQSLLGVINDILDFSKIEAGMLELETTVFDLAEVMDQIGSLVTFSAEEKGIEVMFHISPDAPRYLVGDPLRLSQVLTNLVNNAVKFTEKGEVLIRVDKADAGQDAVLMRFSVEDTGIGMTEEQIKGLFRPFSQADASITRRFGGTGLGLTICKRLVAKMGGEIYVRSEAGKGSNFSFTARFGLVPESHDHRYFTPPDLSGLRVLVVDDNATAREIFHEMLTSFSFKVTAVDSGKAAMEEIERVSRNMEEESYRLVVMDWKMPEMDGISTAERISRNKDLPYAPVIIMVTAFEREEVRQKAGEAGIKMFISKPVHPSALFNAIMDALGRSAVAKPQKRRSGLLIDRALKRLGGADVLVMEDHPINQQVAKEILEKAGMKVALAGNGKEGLSLIREGRRFDAILMDLQMPEMDGYEATRLIRKDDGVTPIIAMTAHALAEDRDKCLAAGMNDHVPKPMDPDSLYSVLIKWVRPRVNAGSGYKVEEKLQGSSDETFIPSDLPGIDVESGLNRMVGNKTLFKTLILNFAQKKATATEDIRRFINDSDMEKAGEIIHNIKGSSGNISAVKVYETATELEAAIRQGRLDMVQPLLDDLEGEMKEVFESADILKSGSAFPRARVDAGLDREEAASLMKELTEMLNLHDLQAISVMKRLSHEAAGMVPDTDLARLSSLINRLNFGEAREILLSLAGKMGISLEGGSDEA